MLTGSKSAVFASANPIQRTSSERDWDGERGFTAPGSLGLPTRSSRSQGGALVPGLAGRMSTVIKSKISSGLFPAPDANTLYVIYFPSSTSIELDGAGSCQQFGGYHNTTTVTQGSATLNVPPAQYSDQRPAVVRPAHRDQVRVDLTVPVHVDPAAVEVEQVQRDLGVRRTGVGVGHGAGRRRRVGRVVQRPARYPGLVHLS